MVVALPLLLLLATFQGQPEPKPIPKDSVEIAARGCLTGRVFTAIARGEEAEVERGPDVSGRTFRVTAPKEVMKQVKAHNGHLVDVAGLVRTAALADNAPGKRIGNTRIIIGTPPGSGPGGAPVANYTVMDLTAVRFVSDTCPIDRR
jgi:hypothetical protein